MSKKCPKCGGDSLSYHTYCREHFNEYKRQWYNNLPEKYKEEYKRRTRQDTLKRNYRKTSPISSESDNERKG